MSVNGVDSGSRADQAQSNRRSEEARVAQNAKRQQQDEEVMEDRRTQESGRGENVDLTI
jgi:hypothetical protein